MRLARRFGLIVAVVLAAGALADGGAPAVEHGQTLVFPRDLREISYYPADGGWVLMWSDWRPDRYAADFSRIRDLGANTVRIIVHPELFGYPQPDAVYLDRLRQMVDLAGASSLRVQLTLFDWFYRFDDVAGSQRWAEAVLAPFVGDERVIVVELKNEIDTGDPVALSWARAMIPFLQTLLDHRTPVTISAVGADQVDALTTLKASLGQMRPDFYSLHDYGGGGERAYWVFRAAKRLVAPAPLWIGETGYPSTPASTGYGDLPPTPSAQEAAQAHFLKTVAVAAWRNDLPPIGVWAFTDFQPGAIPPQDPASPKPVPEAEYHFGLYRTDGSAKPAADAVRRIFTGSQPPLEFNNGFEKAVVGANGKAFPAEWSGGAFPNGVLTQATSVAHSGRASVEVRSLDRRPTTGALYITPSDAAVPANGTVRASVWVRVRGARAQTRLALVWLGARSQPVGTREVRLGRHGSGWTQLRLASRRPAAARSTRIYLKVVGSTGAVWFDDVRFTVEPPAR